MVAVAELVPAVTGGTGLLQQSPDCEPGAYSISHFQCGSCGLAEADGLMPFICPLE